MNAIFETSIDRDGSIKRLIFGHLDAQSLCKLSQVNHKLYDFINTDEELWRYQYAATYGEFKPFVPELNKEVKCGWKYRFESVQLYPGYEWNIIQSENDWIIEMKFPIPESATIKSKGGNIQVNITRDTIQAGLKNQTPTVEGKLHAPVKPKDTVWQIEKVEGKRPYVIVHLSPEDIDSYRKDISGVQPRLIDGPRNEEDPESIDSLSRGFLKVEMPDLPCKNPYKSRQELLDDFIFENRAVIEAFAREKQLKEKLQQQELERQRQQSEMPPLEDFSQNNKKNLSSSSSSSKSTKRSTLTSSKDKKSSNSKKAEKTETKKKSSKKSNKDKETEVQSESGIVSVFKNYYDVIGLAAFGIAAAIVVHRYNQ